MPNSPKKSLPRSKKKRQPLLQCLRPQPNKNLQLRRNRLKKLLLNRKLSNKTKPRLSRKRRLKLRPRLNKRLNRKLLQKRNLKLRPRLRLKLKLLLRLR